MQSLSLVQTIIVWALPILFAVTLHEVAHGWMANQLGDPTAKMLGRLTVNPLKHIDPVGTVIVPLLLLTLGGFIFGWAKPVPVTVENLREPKRDMAIVAAAGPAANLLMALFWAMVMKVAAFLPWPAVVTPLIYMGYAGIAINLVLMILNLLPIPPLDGSRVLSGFLSNKMAWQLSRLEPYGLIILVLLLATGVLGMIISPLFKYAETMIYTLFGMGG
jgi:Zn-dependent protease